MRRLTGGCAWMGLIAALLAPEAFATDWPQWRGPEGTGVSPERGIPIVWHEERSIIWKCALPEWGTSTPAVFGDAIFVTTHTADEKLLVLRIDKRTGQVVWTRQVGSNAEKYAGPQRQAVKFHKHYSPASPSPVTDGQVVVVHFGNGDLAAYDFAGERLWLRNLQEEYGAYTSWYGHANSPVIAGDLVISVCLQDSLSDLREKPIESYLVAHDLRSGHVRWKVARPTKAEAEQGDAYTTPLFCTLNGARQLIVMGGNQLDSYDAPSGQQLWRLPGLVGGRTVTSPTVAHDMIFATRGLRGPMLAIKPKQAGELTFRNIAWTSNEGTPDTCSPVVFGDLLFFVADNGIARCLDAASGNLKWSQRLKGEYKASPVAADGRIFFLNTDGLCTVVSASPRFDRLVENQLADQTVASPAISDGRIYIRGRKTLYCIGR